MTAPITPEKLPAISLRQPWANLIVTGFKDVEFRSKPTKIRGPIYIYASLGKSKAEEEAVLILIGMSSWMYNEGFDRGAIVGTAEIIYCVQNGDDDSGYQWHLDNMVYFDEPLAVPDGVQPQPSIWYPFGKP